MTLGDYRDLYVLLKGEECGAVKFLDQKIAESDLGRNEPVIAPDSQVILLLSTMSAGEGAL